MLCRNHNLKLIVRLNVLQDQEDNIHLQQNSEDLPVMEFSYPDIECDNDTDREIDGKVREMFLDEDPEETLGTKNEHYDANSDEDEPKLPDSRGLAKEARG